jgi:Sigma-70, region 4/Putative zinc-finger
MTRRAPRAWRSRLISLGSVDEVRDFCARVLGPGEAALAAADEASRRPAEGRTELLAAAAQACRKRSEQTAVEPSAPDGAPDASLASAVARELAVATAKLPERHREVLALRDALGLSHEQIAAVMRIEATAVAPLVARARLQLRAERRGTPVDDPAGTCPERDQALRLLARRQDSEPLDGEEDNWLHAHLDECGSCRRSHAAMLEASACYRAWKPENLGVPTSHSKP